MHNILARIGKREDEKRIRDDLIARIEGKRKERKKRTVRREIIHQRIENREKIKKKKEKGEK